LRRIVQDCGYAFQFEAGVSADDMLRVGKAPLAAAIAPLSTARYSPAPMRPA
jgi:hypothetical protein